MTLTKQQAKIKAMLIKNGVNNLQQFGYPDCGEDNILTDQVYAEFFKNMLNENKGNGSDIDAAIDSLLKEIN